MTEPLTFKRSLLWARWVFRWLGEARLLWLALGVAAVALFIAFGSNTSESRIRITGLGLQVLGLATVIWGLRKTGQLFGRPTLLVALLAWLSRFPSYQPRIVGAVGTITAGATASGRGSVRASAPPDASLKKKIEVLERNLGFVSAEVEQLYRELGRTHREMKDALRDEVQQRGDSDEKLHKHLEAAQAGGLYVATMGTLWLFIGVSMSTASLELSKWVG